MVRAPCECLVVAGPPACTLLEVRPVAPSRHSRPTLWRRVARCCLPHLMLPRDEPVHSSPCGVRHMAVTWPTR